MDILKKRLSLYVGPMFSEKTLKLIGIAKLVRKSMGEEYVLVVKHFLDGRYGLEYLGAHNGERYSPCHPIDASYRILPLLKEFPKAKIILWDELQFFNDQDLISVIKELYERKYFLAISGLDYTFKREWFGQMKEVRALVLSLGGDVIKLKANCTVCGVLCRYTQRFSPDGLPDSPISIDVVVGERDLYQPRCLFHFNEKYVPIDHPNYRGHRF